MQKLGTITTSKLTNCRLINSVSARNFPTALRQWEILPFGTKVGEEFKKN